MAAKIDKGEQVRNRVITEFEYIVNLRPGKLARYLRTKLAHNQGCPPANLLHVFTMCEQSSSCDECWWVWLCSEHEEGDHARKKPELEKRCWDCRWGAKSTNAHPFVACMNKRFYGVIQDPEDYCSLFDRLEEVPKKPDVELALKLGELKEENKEEVGAEIRKRFELKQLLREQERRRREKEMLAESSDEKKEETC